MQEGLAQAAAEVVQEVWDLVDQLHVDPHGEVFDHQRCAAIPR